MNYELRITSTVPLLTRRPPPRPPPRTALPPPPAPPAPALFQLQVSLTLYVYTSSGFVEN
ncbi:MAG: hypothetical protein LBQ31_09475 [Bacteroidales bacterium]|nr:hypothetical protein [Bacteroidales bacterium]